jgi:hypothetical protein
MPSRVFNAATRRKILAPTVLVLGLLLTVLTASAAAPPNIDTFATSQPTLNATLGFPASGSVNEVSAGEILGTQREAHAQVTSGVNNLSVIFNGSTMSISTGDATVGTTTLTYDGATNSDPNPSAVDPIGLCTSVGVGCPDLTQGGTTNGFRIQVPSDDTFGTLTVRVWWGGDNTGNSSCQQTFTNFFGGGFPTGPGRDFFVEYPAILGGTCVGTTTNLFSQAGAVQFQITGASLDMTIDTIDISVFDWGDLPQTGNCSTSPYATTLACQGPRHIVTPGTPGLRLGTLIDPGVSPSSVGEINGQPSADAKGDDNANIDDEDGVVPITTPVWVLPGGGGGGVGTVSVTVQGTGYLVGWIDLNNNGFQASEAFINTTVSPGTANYSFLIPPGTVPSGGVATLYARFRLFPPGEITSALAPFAFDGRDQFNQFIPLGLTPPGQAKGGEVEDHVYYVGEGTLAVTLADLRAEAQSDHVLVTWETVSEVNNQGFNLYRSTSPDAAGEKINATLIPSQAPGSAQGAVYTWQDADVTAGTTYYYTLEDLDLSGASSLHGPVSAAFQAPTAVALGSLTASAGALPTAAPLAASVLAATAAAWLAIRRKRSQ